MTPRPNALTRTECLIVLAAVIPLAILLFLAVCLSGDCPPAPAREKPAADLRQLVSDPRTVPQGTGGFFPPTQPAASGPAGP